MESPGTNIPEFAVGELSGAVKRTLEGAFGRIRVRGELTEVKAYGPTRFYFSLKDTDPGSKAKLNAVIWSWTSRHGLKPENGTEVIATGRLTAYGDRSSYQLTVDRLEFAGAGAMLARIEAIKAKLLAEGLFDEGRKRPLPLLPNLVAVVTSAQGAVIQDIRTTIARRFPRPIQLWPVPVQGDGAAERIAQALRQLAALPAHGPVPRPDVVILARGGGSLEDLMAFNDEEVVRAVAAMPFPIVSAVGHETDTTLVDFASDLRAPTPTAAAELCVPARVELLAQVASAGALLARSSLARLRECRHRAERAAAGLPDLPAVLGTLRQRLDDRGERLRAAVPGFVAARKLRLARAPLPDQRPRVAAAIGAVRVLEARRATAWPNVVLALRAQLAGAAQCLPDPREGIVARAGSLALLSSQLGAALRARVSHAHSEPAFCRFGPAPVEALLRERRARLLGLSRELEAISHQSVVGRGYAMVTDSEGRTVSAASRVKPGSRLSLTFADGTAQVVADGAMAPRRSAPKPVQETLL